MKPGILFAALLAPVFVLSIVGSALAYSSFGSCSSCHELDLGHPDGQAWHQMHEPLTCIQGSCNYCHQYSPALQRTTCDNCHMDRGLSRHHQCAGGGTSCIGCHGSTPPTEDTDLSACLDECDDLLDNDGDCLYDGDDPDCITAAFTLSLAASYTAGSLHLQFTLGLPEPATWSNYLILISPTVQVIPLWSVPLPAIDPPMDLPISFPFPAMGMIGFYTGLFTAGGQQAFELAWVDTVL